MSRIHSDLRRMTLEEYLEFEENSPIKHEYVAGEVFAMSGVTTRHNLINLNMTHHLRDAAKRRGCRVFGMEVKLRAGKDRIYYPDIIVACGKAADVELIVEAPAVVVEITSPSTHATDRREKLDAYQRLPSLRSYLVVEQRRRQVIVYTRTRGAWRRDEVAGAGDAAIPALGLTLTLDDIYDDVPLPPLTVGEEDEDFDDADEL
ncbi:MAG: Uma2 family endonuclease [Gemmatimonadaceae bacterium]